MIHPKPRNEGGRLIDFQDDRWLHPDFRPMKIQTTAYMWNSYLETTNPELSLEEKEQVQRDYIESLKAITPTMPLPEDFEERIINVPGCPEEKEAETWMVERCQKSSAGTPRPAIIYIMGGADTYCSPKDAPLVDWAKAFDAAAFSPYYRDSVHGQYPAPINDLHACYAYLVEHAAELDIDPDRIFIVGISTGAQMALCLAFRLKRYGFKPRGVLALSPICDERGISPSSRFWGDAWDGEALRKCYRQYLGEAFASPFVGPEAMAGRATVEEAKGLCPIFLTVPEIDPQRDDSIKFALTCYEAGVYCDLHVWAGNGHGMPQVRFDLAAPSADLSNVTAPAIAGMPDMPEPILDECLTKLVKKFVNDCLDKDMGRSWLWDEQQ
jgi:acetyl esterase/lipase